MTFSERMVEMLDHGMAASKDFAVKASIKAQDLGERGVLMLEIKHMESQAQKLMNRLGNETYKAFAEKLQDSINRDSTEIMSIIKDISALRDSIEQKEANLRDRQRF